MYIYIYYCICTYSPLSIDFPVLDFAVVCLDFQHLGSIVSDDGIVQCHLPLDQLKLFPKSARCSTHWCLTRCWKSPSSIQPWTWHINHWFGRCWRSPHFCGTFHMYPCCSGVFQGWKLGPKWGRVYRTVFRDGSGQSLGNSYCNRLRMTYVYIMVCIYIYIYTVYIYTYIYIQYSMYIYIYYICVQCVYVYIYIQCVCVCIFILYKYIYIIE